LIGVQLDLIKLKLHFWINGKPLENNKDQKHIKDIPAGRSWLPCVIIQEEGLEVILNPFCVSTEKAMS
jgi:hypothetical protein